MNEKRFTGDVARLRNPERRARMQVERVVGYCLANLPLESVLDVGSGTGLFAEAFAQKGLSVAGVDCNTEFLEVAKTMVPKGEFKVAVAEELPFAEGQFDMVFMGHLLHETDDPEKAVREAFRVSRKRLAILEWPYCQQEIGPPLDHRIALEDIKEYGFAAGFTLCDVIQLKVMQLVIFDR